MDQVQSAWDKRGSVMLSSGFVVTGTDAPSHVPSFSRSSVIEEGMATKHVSTPCSMSFRLLVALVGAFCVLLVGLVIWGISYAAGSSGVLLVEQDLRGSITSSIENELTSFVRSAFDGVTMMGELIRLDALRNGLSVLSSRHVRYRPFVFPTARQFAPTLYVGFPDGFFLGYSRLGPQAAANGSYVLIESALGQELQQDFYIDRTGAPIEQYGQRFYNATLRPWYREALAGEPIFTNVYAFTRVSALGITSVLPIFEDLAPPNFYDLSTPQLVPNVSASEVPQTRTIAAVLAADLTLDFLSEFLGQLTIGKTGEAFVLDRNGFLLGSSAVERLGGAAVTETLTHSTLVEDAVVNQTMEVLVRMADPPIDRDNYTDYIRLSDVESGAVAAAGASYQVTVERFDQLDWLVVVLIPTDDYLAAPQAVFFVSLVVALVLIVVIAGVLVVLSSLMTRPMKMIQMSMENITKDLKFDSDEDKDRSHLNEIESIQESFSRMKRGLISFSRYVPMSVVRILMNNNSSAVLGVDQGTAVSFFSDIEGFTSIAESLDPIVLINTLEEYFDRMSGIIDACHGTVGDYIGDAIFAFWNAPVPVDRYAYQACHAVLLQQQALVELRSDWKRRGMPQLRVRMGLTLGRVLMGNVGSSRRLKYTLLGDAVNLAARLESVNKVYGTHVLVADSLRDAVIEEFVFRTVDDIMVVGKSCETRVYELLDWRENASESALAQELLSEDAIELYRQRCWDEAAEKFEKILELRPGDACSELFLERIAKCREEEPPENWSAVTRMGSKTQSHVK